MDLVATEELSRCILEDAVDSPEKASELDQGQGRLKKPTNLNYFRVKIFVLNSTAGALRSVRRLKYLPIVLSPHP